MYINIHINVYIHVNPYNHVKMQEKLCQKMAKWGKQRYK